MKWVAVFVLLALASATGHAQVSAERLVIESYAGPRPREAQHAMAALRERLAARGYLARPKDIAALLVGQVPLPGTSDPDFTPRVFAKEIDAGENLYIDANYRAAAARLRDAIDRVHRNPGVLRDAQSRELKLKGLVLLAQSYGRWSEERGNKDAQAHARARDEAMLEVHRSFPNKVITVKQFGPEGERLWRAVGATVERGGRGLLQVTVDDPDVLVYVNEIPRGHSVVAMSDLIPGHYRVLLVPPSGASRLFTVQVQARNEARLAVNWQIASVLVAGEEYVGLRFETETARKGEGLIARQLARELGGLAVAVLTIDQTRRRTAIVGSLYAVWSGKLVRSGMIELGSRDDGARLDQLVTYLDPKSDQRALKLVVPVPVADYVAVPLEDKENTAQVVPAPRFAAGAPTIDRSDVRLPAPRARHSHLGEVLLVSGGLAAAGMGAFLVAIDGTSTCGDAVPINQCRYLRDTKVGGWTSIGVGAAAIGVGAWLHLRHRSSVTISATPTSNGALASASWSF